MALKNQNPPQNKTHQRQGGGQTPATGEQHDSKKAEKIPASKRWDENAQKIETDDN